MLRIQQLKLKPDHTETELRRAVAKALHIPEQSAFTYEVMRRSIDARKRPDIFYIYTVDAEVPQEERILRGKHLKQVTKIEKKIYRFPDASVGQEKKAVYRPVIAGSGPAGLFCGLMLARAGYCPIILERGKCVEERQRDVEQFWRTGVLHENSNVQFGEGGAGTFSDGKLNTMVKDPEGRIRFVLQTFTDAGADPAVLTDAKPHVGTDVLVDVVRNIRNEIIRLGGSVLFDHCLTDLTEESDQVYRLMLSDGSELLTNVLVLAVGHSARDTFEMLYKKKFEMIPKAFAVGVRTEHPQEWIDRALYGADCPYELPAAPYKVTHQTKDNTGVYSFCMCPGGYVVNASSEPGRLAVNGMSYHDRNGRNANSAIVVTVSPEDYHAEHPLDGVRFQRELESKAYQAGGGKIPVQRFEDFCLHRRTIKFGCVTPSMKGDYSPADLCGIFPEQISDAIREGIQSFDRQIPGFAHPDTLLSGVESRTSSPVRMIRNEQLESAFSGIYPCGEGAGYAGGIVSAAMDGIRVAEAVVKKFSIDFLSE